MYVTENSFPWEARPRDSKVAWPAPESTYPSPWLFLIAPALAAVGMLSGILGVIIWRAF